MSEGPISPEPEAWLQGLGRTASTHEFVSVIKAHSAAHAGTSKHTHDANAHVLPEEEARLAFHCTSIHRAH